VNGRLIAWLYRGAHRGGLGFGRFDRVESGNRAGRAPCNWPGCQSRQARNFPFCPPCYSRLPKGLQIPLYRTWDGKNDAAALDALQDALDYARGWR
jgi:hypothetical protein